MSECHVFREERDVEELGNPQEYDLTLLPWKIYLQNLLYESIT
jgi:hypothetical protein